MKFKLNLKMKKKGKSLKLWKIITSEKLRKSQKRAQ